MAAKACSFYDMLKDPLQSRNLANDPAFAQVRDAHQELCAEHWPKDKWPKMENADKGKKKDGATVEPAKTDNPKK